MQTVNFDKKRIDEIISKNWGKAHQKEIADLLNREGFTTKLGKPWTHSKVNYYGNEKIKLKQIGRAFPNFNKEKVEAIIIENHKLKQALIAEKLNEEGLFTPKGYKWQHFHVCDYIVSHLPSLRNKRYSLNTVEPITHVVKINGDWIETSENNVKNNSENQETILEVKAEIVNDNVEIKSNKKEASLTFEQRLALIPNSVFENEGKFFTDSLMIAKIFDKKHYDVLEAIRNCDCSEKFKSTEFSVDCFFDDRNRKQPKINLTQKGFTFVIVGFTGEKAGQFKEAYINRFEELENQVKQPKQELITDPLTIMAMSINELKKTNERVNQVEKEFSEFKVNVKQAIQSEIKEANKELEANLEKINKFNDRKVRLAENRLKQTALDLQIEELPNYYDKTKKIVIDYTVVNGLKEEDAGINYDKLYSAMERKFQIPFRQNLEVINQQYPKNKQISKIRYFQQIGLEKQVFDTACELFVEK